MIAEEQHIASVEDIMRIGEEICTFQPISSDQRDFFSSPKTFRWLFGGNQSGKSYCNMLDVAMQALEAHPVAERNRRNGIHWVAIESWEQVRDHLWEKYLSKMIPSSRIINIQWGQGKVPRRITLNNGHNIFFKAFNQGRSQFQGAAIDSFHGDEQCLRDFEGTWWELQARLLVRKGSISWSMTPIWPQMFLEERIENLPLTDATFFLDLEDNRKSQGGALDDVFVDKLLSQWGEEEKVTRKEGRFKSYLGSVFQAFDRSVHIVEPFKIPLTWRRYRGIDFGFKNPFACLWAAKDSDDTWYIYREYYKAKTGIQDHISAIKKLSGKENYVSNIADPENAGDRHELSKAGIPTLAANKRVAPGIETVQRVLKVGENGYPSLYIFNTCKNLIRELTLYRWSEKIKGDVVKENDHTVDALRYILHTTRKRKKSRVL